MTNPTYRCSACYTPGWPDLNPGCIPLMTCPEPDGVHALFYCTRSDEMVDWRPDGRQERYPFDLVLSAGNLTPAAITVRDMLVPAWPDAPMPAFNNPERRVEHLLTRRVDGNVMEYSYSHLTGEILMRQGPQDDNYVTRHPADVFSMLRAREAGTNQWGFYLNAARLILVRKRVSGTEGPRRYRGRDEDGIYLGGHVNKRGRRVDLYYRDVPTPQVLVRYGDHVANSGIASYDVNEPPTEATTSLGVWEDYQYALVEAWRRQRTDDVARLRTRGLTPEGAPYVEDKTRRRSDGPILEVGRQRIVASTTLTASGAPRFPKFETTLSFSDGNSTTQKDMVIGSGWRVMTRGEEFAARLNRFLLKTNPTREDLLPLGGGDLAVLLLKSSLEKLVVAAKMCQLSLWQTGDIAQLIIPSSVTRIMRDESFASLKENASTGMWYPYALDLAAELKRGSPRWHIINK